MAQIAKVEDNCIKQYDEMKKGKSIRYIIFGVKEQGVQVLFKIKQNTVDQVFVEKIGDKSKTYQDFLKDIPGEQPRFAVIDFEYKTKDVPPLNISRLIYIFWSPDQASMKQKFLYANSNDACKKSFPCQKQYEFHDFSEVIQTLLNFCSNQLNNSLMKNN